MPAKVDPSESSVICHPSDFVTQNVSGLTRIPPLFVRSDTEPKSGSVHRQALQTPLGTLRHPRFRDRALSQQAPFCHASTYCRNYIAGRWFDQNRGVAEVPVRNV